MSNPRILAALLALSLSPACTIHFGDWGDPDVWVEETETFTVSADTVSARRLERLYCKTHNGRITAEGQANSDDIRVTVKKKAGGDDLEDAEDAMDAIRIISEDENGELILAWEWREGRDRDWRAVVSFDIEQPSRFAVKVRTHNGRIGLSGIDGSCTAKSHNGGIKVATAGGTVDLETHNGAIVADLAAERSIEASISTHNGGVNINLAHAISAKVRCSTHNGSISSDLDLGDRFKGRNFLSGDLGDGDGKLDIRTHNGSIRLR